MNASYFVFLISYSYILTWRLHYLIFNRLRLLKLISWLFLNWLLGLFYRRFCRLWLELRNLIIFLSLNLVNLRQTVVVWLCVVIRLEVKYFIFWHCYPNTKKQIAHQFQFINISDIQVNYSWWFINWKSPSSLTIFNKLDNQNIDTKKL